MGLRICIREDGRINVSSLVNDLEIPTIGILNGPGFHPEICLMCDLTICSEDAVLYDLHYDIGSVPGDGIHSCFLELLGVKRGAYALLTGEAINAQKALEYGLVNEVVPRDKLIERVYQARRSHHDTTSNDTPPDDTDRPSSVEEAHCRRSRRRLRNPDVRPSCEGSGGARPQPHQEQGRLRQKG